MKRYILLLFCILSFMNVKAQDDKKVYLPKQGNIAVSFDAAPILKYAGNIFNATSNNSFDNIGGKPTSAEGTEYFEIEGITPDVSIMGKYMLTDNFAIRANIGVQLRSLTTNIYVTDDMSNITNPLSENKLIDTRYDTKNGLSANVGVEYRKGDNRIQGIFGGGILLGRNNVKTEYQYANALTILNQSPSSAWNATYGDYRILNEVTNSNMFFGITGNVGIEWFVSPMISLGAEVNLTAYHVKGAQTYITSEGYSPALNDVVTRNDIISPGDKALVFGTDNLGGSLYLSFYF